MSNIIRIPGLIDIHVHLRDPGQTHKEDFYTGTSAALAGGVTTIFDMPNNLDPIFTYDKLVRKINIAKEKAVCDWGLYFGTDGKNLDEFDKVKNFVMGLKIYLNLTTGKILIKDNKLIERVFASWPKNKIIIVHGERNKVDLAIKFAHKYNNRIHITHVRKYELQKIIKARKEGLIISCDVTINHLFLTNEDEKRLGNLGRVKPPLSNRSDQEFLWNNLDSIDCIASDHAPHTSEDKIKSNNASGFTGLETMLPLLLTAVYDKKITLTDMIRLTNVNPQKIFGFKQNENTYAEIDLDKQYQIKNENLKTKCKWSPFSGWKVRGKVKNVFIREAKVFSDGKVLVQPGFGKNILH